MRNLIEEIKELTGFRSSHFTEELRIIIDSYCEDFLHGFKYTCSDIILELSVQGMSYNEFLDSIRGISSLSEGFLEYHWSDLDDKFKKCTIDYYVLSDSFISFHWEDFAVSDLLMRIDHMSPDMFESKLLYRMDKSDIITFLMLPKSDFISESILSKVIDLYKTKEKEHLDELLDNLFYYYLDRLDYE